MKFLSLPQTLFVAAALLAALPVESQARKITVVRDRDGDGHYNKKSIDVGRRSSGNRYYDGRYRGGYPYYYRGYGNGYPYRYGYRPSYGVSFYSAPRYYTTTRSVNVDDDVAEDVQRALRRRGYYYGEIDGDIGPGSRAAIRAYQRDRGLPVTSRIDGSLLRSLGVS